MEHFNTFQTGTLLKMLGELVTSSEVLLLDLQIGNEVVDRTTTSQFLFSDLSHVGM